MAKSLIAWAHPVKCVNDVTYFQGYVTLFGASGSIFVKWEFKLKKQEDEQNRD